MDQLENKAGVHKQIFSPRSQRYTIAIPKGYTDRVVVPFILALHYHGTGTPFFSNGILSGLVVPGLHKLGAIIVAPDCLHGDWANPESEAEILALITHLQENYNLDLRKTLLTGYSMGGYGTWYLAARHQDIFAAAIPMASWPEPESAELSWKIPLYVIHSRADEVVPYEHAETVVRRLKKHGANVKYVLLEGITHYETWRFTGPLQAAVPWIRKVWKEA